MRFPDSFPRPFPIYRNFYLGDTRGRTRGATGPIRGQLEQATSPLNSRADTTFLCKPTDSQVNSELYYHGKYGSTFIVLTFFDEVDQLRNTHKVVMRKNIKLSCQIIKSIPKIP
jgi:hypothetical protein